MHWVAQSNPEYRLHTIDRDGMKKTDGFQQQVFFPKNLRTEQGYLDVASP